MGPFTTMRQQRPKSMRISVAKFPRPLKTQIAHSSKIVNIFNIFDVTAAMHSTYIVQLIIIPEDILFLFEVNT